MKKTFNMATFPKRRISAIATIKSIYDQADIIRIYLNNYIEIPVEFIDDKIEVIIHEKDLRSSGKLYWATNPDEYYFCIDDDLLYPKTYANDMIKLLQEYDDKALISLHGKIFGTFPINSYFRNIKESYHFAQTITQNKKVHVIGNGVSLFNTNIMKVDYKKFDYDYMDDIFVSKIAQDLKIPAILMKHDLRYVVENITNSPSLFSEFNNNDSTQTKIMNTIKWKIY